MSRRNPHPARHHSVNQGSVIVKRASILLYGIGCYVVFLGTFLYAIGFIDNLWVPKSMDSAPGASLVGSLLTDVGLLLVFALQHSIMARPALPTHCFPALP
jgi:hypothetical protein